METIDIRSGNKLMTKLEIHNYSAKSYAIFGNAITEIYPLFNGMRVSFNPSLKYSDGHSPEGYCAGLVFPNALRTKVIKILNSTKAANLFCKLDPNKALNPLHIRRPDFKFSETEANRIEQLNLRLS